MARPIFAAPSRVEKQKVYNPSTMMWEAMTQPSGGSGGSVTVTNMVPAVETGLAKEVTLQSIDAGIAALAGEFATRVDTSASPLIYLGLAAPGSASSAAVWQVTRFDTTVGVIQTYADGNTNFDNIWDNRASLSYS